MIPGYQFPLNKLPNYQLQIYYINRLPVINTQDFSILKHLITSDQYPIILNEN